MNKKHSLILGIICLVLSLACLFMSLWTKNNVDPLHTSSDFMTSSAVVCRRGGDSAR